MDENISETAMQSSEIKYKHSMLFLFLVFTLESITYLLLSHVNTSIQETELH